MSHRREAPKPRVPTFRKMPSSLTPTQILELVLRQIQAKSKSDDDLFRDWQRRFNSFDLTHNGVVTETELGQFLRKHFSMDLNAASLYKLFLHIDKDGGGTLDSAELGMALLKARGGCNATSLMGLGTAQQNNDDSGDSGATHRSAITRKEGNHRHPAERHLQSCTDNTDGTVTQAWLETSLKAATPRGPPQRPSKGSQRVQSAKFQHLAKKDQSGNGYEHTRERLIRTQPWTQPPARAREAMARSSRGGNFPVIETDFQRIIHPAVQQAKNSPHTRGDVGRYGDDPGSNSMSPMWGHLKSSHENTRRLLAGGGGGEVPRSRRPSSTSHNRHTAHNTPRGGGKLQQR